MALTWGTTPEERSFSFPCERLLEDAAAAYYRGVTINAPPEHVFRWLCQMRVAPYSYDWVDNLGRRSPRRLTPGLDQLAVGQRVMTIFELVEFDPSRHLTIRMLPRARRVFGQAVASYVVIPQGTDRCRLLTKLLVRYPRGLLGSVIRRCLPWGDLVMMRRQLLNFKKLSEQTAAEEGPTLLADPTHRSSNGSSDTTTSPS